MTTDDLIENRHDGGFLNIADHDSYIHGVPHASFARLRADDPVHWTTPNDGMRSFWSVTRQADILEAMASRRFFRRQRASASKTRRMKNIWHDVPFRKPTRRIIG